MPVPQKMTAEYLIIALLTHIADDSFGQLQINHIGLCRCVSAFKKNQVALQIVSLDICHPK
jgi:hypothetical protein